jgi:hypothetical protein
MVIACSTGAHESFIHFSGHIFGVLIVRKNVFTQYQDL